MKKIVISMMVCVLGLNTVCGMMRPYNSDSGAVARRDVSGNRTVVKANTESQGVAREFLQDQVNVRQILQPTLDGEVVTVRIRDCKADSQEAIVDPEFVNETAAIRTDDNSFGTIIRDAFADVSGEQLPSDPMTEAAIRVATRGVEREYAARIRILVPQVQAEVNRMEDGYRRELEILRQKIANLNKTIQKMEKQNVLSTKIFRIFLANPFLKAEKIMIRSNDIICMSDVITKHNTVKEFYGRIVLFAELLSSKENLNKVKDYVDKIDSLLAKKEKIMQLCIYWGARLDTWGDTAEFGRSRKYPENPWFPPNPGVVYYSHDVGRSLLLAFHAENDRRTKSNQDIQRQIEKYDQLNFPVVCLDNLILQYNQFVNLL